ncbi:MAG: sigma-70 domain-containing protein, partial [Candidatus Kryptoniota bacterium]
MAWKENPSRENGTKLMRVARPIIEQVVTSYLGIQNVTDPLLIGRAQIILLKAFENYDPTKGPITAFIWTNLQRLQRVYGRQQSVISVPEQIILDSRRLENAEKELEEKLGRKPSTDELADYTKLSVKRIEKIRRQASVGYESSFERGVDKTTGGWLPEVDSGIDPETNRKLLQIMYESLGN